MGLNFTPCALQHIFLINGLDEETERMFVKFEDDTKVGGIINTLEDRKTKNKTNK